MWGIPDAPFVPDSEEDFRVVYGEDEPGLDDDEGAQQGRAGPRRRYDFAQAGSLVRATTSEALLTATAAGGCGERPATTQHPTQRQQPPRSPAASGGCVPDSGGASPGNSDDQVGGVQHPPVSLARELQTVLHGLTQQRQQQQQQQLPACTQAQQQQWGGASGGHLPVRQELTQRKQPEEQQQQQKQLGGWRTRQDVVRRINQVSPAVPPAAQLPPPAAGGGRPTSAGRRWRQAQAASEAAATAAAAFAPAPSRRTASPAAPASDALPLAAGHGAGAATGAFFSVDEDLLQAHVHRQVHQAAPGRQQGRRLQPRTVQWQSPQAGAAGAAEHTPVPASQRINPLASLLGGGGGGGSSAVKPRAATTGGKVRGRHPIYGQVAAVQQDSQASQAPPEAPSNSTGSRLRNLGLRDAPLTSPRQAQQRRPPQQQHSRFAIREPATAAPARVQQPEAAVPAAAAAAASAAVPAAVGLRQLTGEAPASASRLPHQFQPRPRRPASPGEQIVDEEEAGEGAGREAGEADWWQQQPWERQAHAQQQRQQQQQQEEQRQAAAADSFRTPGQPLRRSWLDDGEDNLQQPQQQAQQQQPQQPQQQAQQQHPGAPPSAPPAATAAGSFRRGAVAGGGGSTGRGGAMSLQRAFVAQLQPVSSSVAAATLQQQRQRLAGAAGLHARLQALLAAEKAAQEESPGGGGAGAGPRLTVLDKQLEGSITKCLCRCDSVAAAALGSPEVVALFQSRTAQRVDTAPGSIVLLRQPWRVMPLAGSHAPAVLCFAASVG